MGRKVLVVDDEERIVRILKAYLEREGYAVLAASDGRQALDLARRETPDAVVLDLMLPEMSGWDVCRALRQESNVPIIMLTARDDLTDKVVGLELGADDYVTKPFEPRELLARLHAVLRRVNRTTPLQSFVLRHGELEIDTEAHEVRLGGQPIALTPSEFALLETLARQPGRVFTRLQLLEAIQGEAFAGYERVIDSHVKNLRRKIEPASSASAGGFRYVQTVHGIGYKFGRDSGDA